MDFKNTVIKFCFVLALLCGGCANDLRCLSGSGAGSQYILFDPPNTPFGPDDPYFDPNDPNLPPYMVIRQRRRPVNRTLFPRYEVTFDKADVGHFAIETGHRGGIYYLHDIFIEKHKKFILKQIIRDHEVLLELLNDIERYNDAGTTREVKNYLEDKHNFVGLNISKEEWKNILGFALISSGEAVAAQGFHEMTGPLGPRVVGNTRFIPCFATANGAFRRLVELPAKIYYLFKAEGWSGFLRGIALNVSGYIIESLGGLSDSRAVKVGFKLASEAYRSIYRMKVFNNFCRNTWIEYVFDNPSRLRELIEEYARARETRNKQDIVEAVNELKEFVKRGHDNIPEFRKFIS